MLISDTALLSLTVKPVMGPSLSLTAKSKCGKNAFEIHMIVIITSRQMEWSESFSFRDSKLFSFFARQISLLLQEGVHTQALAACILSGQPAWGFMSDICHLSLALHWSDLRLTFWCNWLI